MYVNIVYTTVIITLTTVYRVLVSCPNPDYVTDYHTNIQIYNLCSNSKQLFILLH